MSSIRFLVVTMFAAVVGFAQPARIELLSRSDDPAPRAGASGMAVLPEFSRDGNYVLFLSEAPNLARNRPGAKPALNLFMTDLRTGETTLLSEGMNGEPANENVVNFEISANNRRVLIETAAWNLIANDTNNASDVFIRDLDLKQNILASVNTNGVVSWRGASGATMSADGNRVAFSSSDKSLAPDRVTGANTEV